MKQLSFSFTKYYSDPGYQKEQKNREKFANKYVQKSCGWLHLGWDIDAYWAKVTKDFLLPSSILIHQELVTKNHTEENKLYSCTGALQFWYIPTKSKTRKVFVQDSYDQMYLFVYDESKCGKTFHIRKVWKTWNPDVDDCRTEDVINLVESKDVLKIISHLNCFENFSDDHYKYGKKHSLDFYKILDFDFDHFNDKYRIFGDTRDLGYIISYKSIYNTYKCEDTSRKFGELEYISTCAISIAAQELEIDIPKLNGSD